MGIKNISQDEFDSYEPVRATITRFLVEEIGWYVDTHGNIIGAVLRDRTDNDWGYVILGRDEKGNFRCFDLEASIETEDSARKKLTAAMVKIGASG